jgi:hypothetical protein
LRASVAVPSMAKAGETLARRFIESPDLLNQVPWPHWAHRTEVSPVCALLIL